MNVRKPKLEFHQTISTALLALCLVNQTHKLSVHVVLLTENFVQTSYFRENLHCKSMCVLKRGSRSVELISYLACPSDIYIINHCLLWLINIQFSIIIGLPIKVLHIRP